MLGQDSTSCLRIGNDEKIENSNILKDGTSHSTVQILYKPIENLYLDEKTQKRLHNSADMSKFNGNFH